jgi:hypothetical protein
MVLYQPVAFGSSENVVKSAAYATHDDKQADQ